MTAGCTVAVTGINAVDSPGPGVPIARCLKEGQSNYNVIGLAYDVLEPGNFMGDLLTASFILPYPSSGPESLLGRILEIHARQPLDMILPALDSELDNFIAVQDRLLEHNIRLFIPGNDQLHLRDKTRLNESLEGTGVKIPETVIMGDLPALDKAVQRFGFPMQIKGLYYEAYLARNPEEAAGYFYRISSKWGLPVIAQRYIKGEESNIAAVARDGRMLGGVAMKKMFLTDKGKAWAGVTIKNDELFELSHTVLKKINWSGACELEYIIENKSGDIYLLEINPRFPAWIYLAKAAGQNLPEMAVRLAMGEEVTALDSYDTGVVFVRHSWDDIIPLSEIEMLSTRGEIKRHG